MKLNKFALRALGVTVAAASITAYAETHTLVLAGGAFWAVEADFENVEGVLNVVSGYAGGTVENPTYKDISTTDTGHYEVVKITFDSTKVSLRALTDYYWKTIDPTDLMGQFCDKGRQYRTALFYQNEGQKAVFEASKLSVQQDQPFTGNFVTAILPASTFYPAEEVHQNYFQTHEIRYNVYRRNCGRDDRIKSLWGEVASRAFRG